MTVLQGSVVEWTLGKYCSIRNASGVYEQKYCGITMEQFDEIYGDLVDKEIFLTDPATEESYLVDYMSSKLWRLNNLYTIINKDGERVPFLMNYAQHRVYRASLDHSRLIILKSRQQGISTFWLVSFLDDSIVNPDLNIGLMAQGKSEAGTLLKRVKLAWETFPPELKDFFTVKLTRDNNEEFAFSNNTTMFIRVSFRSATLMRLHISEYGKICKVSPERAKETKTGTLQAIKPGNLVAIESTAEGDNDFKKMWDLAVESEAKVFRESLDHYPSKDFKPVFLSWLDDPDCVASDYESPSLNDLKYFKELEAETGRTLTREQRNFWIAQYRELGDTIYQEYPATPTEAFTKVNDGSYYGIAYHTNIVRKGRVVSDLYDPNLSVRVVMDLGMHDTFVLLFFQRWRTEWRIIDEYCHSGEGLEFYVDYMNKTDYDIEEVIGPHDLSVKELGMNMTREARLRELGVRRLKVLERTPIADGIEQVRKVMKNLWIDAKCVYLIGCFKNYSKEWDEKHEVWRNKPLHDKWSHGADTIRGMVMSGSKQTGDTSPRENKPSQNLGVADGIAF